MCDIEKPIKNVLLLNPFFYRKRNINITIDPVVRRCAGQLIKTGLTFPIGLAYMAATLRQRGFKVQLLDPLAKKLLILDIYKAAENADAIVMPFSPIHMHDTKKFRDNFKHKFFVLGGIYAELMSKDLLNNDYCDVVINVEPELSVVELMNKYPVIEDVSGIIYKDKKSGVVIEKKSDFLIQELDQLPFPARDLVNPKIYWEIPFFGQPTAWILSSRGCPYDCIFCTKIPGMTRLRSTKNIVDEIECVVKDFDIKNFSFFDDNFNQDSNFTKGVCNEIIERKLGIKWCCSARADSIEEDIASLMKKSGCVEIRIGLESANDNILGYFRKDTTVKKISKGLRILKNIGLSYSLQCIFGSPLENVATLRNTMNFVKKSKPLFVSFNILTPLPGSKIFKDNKNEINFNQIKHFDLLHTNYTMSCYSVEELHKILKRAYVSYYLNINYLLRVFREIMKRPDILGGVIKTVYKQVCFIYSSIIRDKGRENN